MSADQPLHEYLRAHARQRPDHAAVIWYGRAITWRELDDWSDALGAHLQGIGVAQGDPVALFMNNCPQYMVAHYAIQKIGAIVCPCGPLNKAHELQYQLDDLGARVIIAADNLLPIVEQVRGDTALAHVLAARYGELLPSEPDLPVPPEIQGATAPLPPGCGDMLQIARTGAQAAVSPLQRWASGGTSAGSAASAASGEAPAWANRMRRSQRLAHGTQATLHAIRSGDSHGGGASISLFEGNS